MKHRRTIWSVALLALIIAAPAAAPFLLNRESREIVPLSVLPAVEPATTTHTVETRLAQFGTDARERLAPDFEKAGVSYPPESIVLVGLKTERRLEVFARSADHAVPRFIKSYDFAAWSGELGPKLREGDRQIPEGLYGITYLNPNSIAHVSLRIGYPNRFERARGAEEGRTDLGGDIMIHGYTWGSRGCVVLEDDEVEEVFTLAADIGIENVRVILSPSDARQGPLRTAPDDPSWTGDLYGTIASALRDLPVGARTEGQRAAAR